MDLFELVLDTRETLATCAARHGALAQWILDVIGPEEPAQ